MNILCLYKTYIAGLVLLAGRLAVSPASEQTWWHTGNLITRSRQWISLALTQPEEAAESLASLYRDESERRIHAALVSLTEHPRFPEAVMNVLAVPVNSQDVDHCLILGGRMVWPVLLSLLETQTASAAAKCRCIQILGEIQSSESVDEKILWEKLVTVLEQEKQAPVLECIAEVLVKTALSYRTQGQHDTEVLTELIQNPKLTNYAQDMILYVLGRLATAQAVKFLIHQSSIQESPEKQTVLLEALESAARQLRQTDPRGEAAEYLLDSAETLWNGGQNAMVLSGATAVTIWAYLKPVRFKQLAQQRTRNAGFWLQTASEKESLRTWCSRISDIYPWPSPERLQAIHDILSAGFDDRCEQQQQVNIAEGLTLAFPEWPLVIATDVLTADDPNLRNAGRELLYLIGNEHNEKAIRTLANLTWPMPTVAGRAVKGAGEVNEPGLWAGRRLVDSVDYSRDLWPGITCKSASLQQVIVEKLLAEGSEADLKHMVRVGDPETRLAALKVLTEKGSMAAAVQWTQLNSAGFLSYLMQLAEQGQEHSVPAVTVLALLLTGSDSDIDKAASLLVRFLPRDWPDTQRVTTFWTSRRNYMDDHKKRVSWFLECILEAPPSPRGDAVVAVLTQSRSLKDWRNLIDNYQNRTKKEIFRKTP